MSSVTQPAPKQDFLAGLLSYLVPGLGQIYQGRTGKGLLFLAGIYGLFFYGMYLGRWQNVYLPQAVEHPETDPAISIPRDVFARPQFLGQVWTGVVVWPAIFQYANYDRKRSVGPLFGSWQRTPYESRVSNPPLIERRGGPDPEQAPRDFPGKTIDEQQTDFDKSYDIGWVCTVVAGVLNILVIYDAFAGPAISAEALAKAREESRKHADPATAAVG
jgi:hypothetical protein